MKSLRVEVDGSGQPTCIFRGERRHRVEAVLEHWREAGRWWAGEEPKAVFRVQLTGGKVWEIICAGEWHLLKVYD